MEIRNAYKISVGKREGKKLLEILILKLIFRETGGEDADWNGREWNGMEWPAPDRLLIRRNFFVLN
jgi:hypothetical protein